MTKRLKEKEFVDQFGEEYYEKVAVFCGMKMRESLLQNSEATEAQAMVVIAVKDMQPEHILIIESQAKKIYREVNGKQQSGVSFQILELYLSDEVMPDVALDKISEYKKLGGVVEEGEG